jgi:channel protein (hemolysin III family)
MRISSELTEPFAGVADPLAACLHLAGGLVLAWYAAGLVRRAGDARRRAAALAVFAASGVVALGVSAAYHVVAPGHAWKPLLQQADHAAIFLLIAGTLTPFHAIVFRGRARVWLVGGIWALALALLVAKWALWSRVGDGLGLGLYIGLSTAGLLPLLLLPRRVPWHALGGMAAGAALYVGGALADYAKLVWIIPGVLGPHEIFHVAVLTALALHGRFFHAWAAPGPAPAPPEPAAAPVPA